MLVFFFVLTLIVIFMLAKCVLLVGDCVEICLLALFLFSFGGRVFVFLQ